METQRNKTITLNGVTAWNTELPKAITTYIPGLNFEEQTTLGMFTLHSYQHIGLLTTLIILPLGLWLIALILELDSRKKNTTITILVIILTLLWIPSFQG